MHILNPNCDPFFQCISYFKQRKLPSTISLGIVLTVKEIPCVLVLQRTPLPPLPSPSGRLGRRDTPTVPPSPAHGARSMAHSSHWEGECVLSPAAEWRPPEACQTLKPHPPLLASIYKLSLGLPNPPDAHPAPFSLYDPEPYPPIDQNE